MRFLSVVFFGFLFCTCHSPNPVYRERIGHIHSVVVLGNSIVASPPAPALGWLHDWGMAASAREKDFVHLLILDIHSRDSSVKIAFRSIPSFELSYRTYDMGRLDSLRGADLYIIKLAENVPDTATGFLPYYDSLLHYLDTRHGLIVVMDGFWKNPVNPGLRDYADSHGYPFIRISDLSRDNTMEARGLFPTYGVSVHPGDKGMQAIEQRIWSYINAYF